MKPNRFWLLVALSGGIVAAVATARPARPAQGHYYQAVCFHEDALPLYWRGPCRYHPNNSTVAWLAAERDATAHNETVHDGRKQASARSPCRDE